MSSLRQRADQLVANEMRRNEILPKKKLGTAKVEMAWKRITARILMMLATARQQMVVDEFYLQDQIEDNQKEKASSSHQTTQKPRTKKTTNVSQGIGQPLARSKAHKTFALEPSACQHPPDKLRCRANSVSQWWTCTLCGSRWQRNDAVDVIPDRLPPTSENEPKIAGSRGQEFPKFLPAPRSRPHQGDKMVELDNYGRPRTLASASSSETGGTGAMPAATPKTSKQPNPATQRSPSRTRTTSHGTRMIQPLKKNAQAVNTETYEINTDDEADTDEEMPVPVKGEN